MTEDERVDLFVESLSLLDVDESRIVCAAERDLVAILQVVEQLAAQTLTDTLHDLALHRLLLATGGLIMQYGFQYGGIQTHPPKPLGTEWLDAYTAFCKLRSEKK